MKNFARRKVGILLLLISIAKSNFSVTLCELSSDDLKGKQNGERTATSQIS
jgi:hypothetical protein